MPGILNFCGVQASSASVASGRFCGVVRSGIAARLLCLVILFCAGSLVGSTMATAQVSYIRGSIQLDRASGKPAAYATVLIPGTLFGGITDAAGRFELGPVPGGDYSLHVVVAGYKEIVVPVSIDGSDVELQLVARRADVDLESNESGILEVDEGARRFPLPGGVVELLRNDPRIEVGRVGGSGGRVQFGPPTGPFANGMPQASSAFSFAAVRPLLRDPSPTYRIIDTTPFSRTYTLAQSGPLSSTLSYDAEASSIEEKPVTVRVDAGAHANGRLVSGGLGVDGSAGRIKYSSRLARIVGDQYRSGDGGHVGAESARSIANADVAVRLTPFSDLLFEYGGVFDGESFQDVAPIFLSRANEQTGVASFRLMRPDHALEQLMVRASIAHSLDRSAISGDEGSQFEGIAISSDALNLSAGSTLRLSSSVDGVLMIVGSRENSEASIGPRLSATELPSWRRSVATVSYEAEAELASGTAHVKVSWEGTKFDQVPSPLSFSSVAANLQYSTPVSSTVNATVGLASYSRTPTAIQLYGSAFPRLVGQYFLPVDGLATLRTERLNALSVRVNSVGATRLFSFGVSMVDLHRYSTVQFINGVAGMIQSEGTSVDLDAKLSLMRPPFASVSLAGYWSAGRDRSLAQGLIGMRSPRAELVMRIQSPGGGFYFQPVVNGLLGRDAVDAQWERSTGGAVWIDLIAGFGIRGSLWTVGVTNLNDAEWRFHSSPLQGLTGRPLYERGRSLFVRFSRTI